MLLELINKYSMKKYTINYRNIIYYLLIVPKLKNPKVKKIIINLKTVY